MAQLVLSVAGTAVGGFFGGTWGARIGFVIGNYLGSRIDSSKIHNEGPRLTDLSFTDSNYGNYIPWIQGTMRIGGQIWWASEKQEHANTQSQGKGGGPTSTTYTYTIDLFIGLTDGEIAGVPRVFSNGKLVYTNLASSDDLSRQASENTNLWERFTIYYGGPSQLPDPVYEAAVGSDLAIAFRGRGGVFIKGLQLGTSGQVPNLTFEVASTLGGSSNIVRRWQDSSGPYAYGTVYGPSNGYACITSINPEIRIGTTGSTSIHRYSADNGTYITTSSKFSSEGIPPTSSHTTIDGVQYWTDPVGSLAGVGITHVDQTPGFSPKGTPNTGVLAGVLLNLTNPLPVGTYLLGIAPCSDGAHILFWGASVQTYTGAPVTTSWYLVSYDGVHLPTLEDQGTCDTTYTITHFGWGSVGKGATTFKSCILEEDLRTVWVANGAGNRDINLYQISSTKVFTHLSSLSNQITQGFAYPSIFASGGLCVVAAYNQILLFRREGDIIRTIELKDAIANTCLRAGLTSDQFDTSDLASSTNDVRGFAQTDVSNMRGLLEQLATAYQFDCVESDKLYFRLRGRSSSVTIPNSDLGAALEVSNKSELFSVNNELELPPQVALSYINAIDDYRTGVELSDRTVSTQNAINSVSLAIVLTPSEAKGVADSIMIDSTSALRTIDFSTDLSYVEREPTDVVTVIDDQGNAFNVRITDKQDDGAILKFVGVFDTADVANPQTTTSLDYVDSTSVSFAPNTLLYLLNAPLLRDIDDAIGIYAVIVASTNKSYSGANIYESINGVEYKYNTIITDTAVAGTCTTTLGDWSKSLVIDESNSVTVNVGIGTLTSTTRDVLLTDATINNILIGNEVIRFVNATLISSNPNIYTLTRLVRGCKNTEQYSIGHVSNELCVLLSANAGIRFITQQVTDIGVSKNWKAVTLGKSIEDVSPVLFTPTDNVRTPASPCDIRAERQINGDVKFTWKRRTRYNTTFCGVNGINVPLDEKVEAYKIEIYADSGYTNLVWSASTQNSNFTVTWADQALLIRSPNKAFTDGIYYVKVYQIGAGASISNSGASVTSITGGVQGWSTKQAIPISYYDQSVLPPTLANTSFQRIRAFFWYNLDDDTVTLADKWAGYGMAETILFCGTEQASTNKWLASLSPGSSLGVNPGIFRYGTGPLLSLPSISGSIANRTVIYDPSNDEWIILEDTIGNGSTLKEYRYASYIQDYANVITIDGIASGYYYFAIPRIFKFNGIYYAYGANSLRREIITRVSAGVWQHVNLPKNPSGQCSLGSGDYPAWLNSFVGVITKTISGTPTLFLFILSMTGNSGTNNPTNIVVYSTTDLVTFTYVSTISTNLGGYSPGMPFRDYNLGSCAKLFNGNFLVYASYQANSWNETSVTSAWISTNDGASWTRYPVTLDGNNADIKDIVITSAGILGCFIEASGTNAAKAHLVKSTDGYTFTTVADSNVWIAGFADQPGDFLPIPQQFWGDLRAPIISSGNKVLFERDLALAAANALNVICKTSSGVLLLRLYQSTAAYYSLDVSTGVVSKLFTSSELLLSDAEYKTNSVTLGSYYFYNRVVFTSDGVNIFRNFRVSKIPTDYSLAPSLVQSNLQIEISPGVNDAVELFSADSSKLYAWSETSYVAESTDGSSWSTLSQATPDGSETYNHSYSYFPAFNWFADRLHKTTSGWLIVAGQFLNKGVYVWITTSSAPTTNWKFISSISTDRYGSSSSNQLHDSYVVGDMCYIAGSFAGLGEGLAVSTDGGNTWTFTSLRRYLFFFKLGTNVVAISYDMKTVAINNGSNTSWTEHSITGLTLGPQDIRPQEGIWIDIGNNNQKFIRTTNGYDWTDV